MSEWEAAAKAALQRREREMGRAEVTEAEIAEKIAADPVAAAAVLCRQEDKLIAAEKELRNLLSAMDESLWHRHAEMGKRVKRICITEDAIARIRVIVGDNACDHPNYAFSEHGRCCPHCGTFMVDFGD
jgi:hypothetical protein